MSPSTSTRYDFLDWLRVIAIFVLLFYHTGMLFVGWGWHIENGDTIAALERPMDIAHRLRMPLLFVIAGAGMWFAMGRRTAGEMVRERSLRLLLPLVFGMFFVVSPQVFYERVFRGDWDGGYVQFFIERVLQLRPYPAGDFSWHHLWFIAYLYVYVLVLMPFMAWWRRANIQLRPGAWLFALALPLGSNEALLKPIYPETHALIGDWYTFNHYLLLTLYGFVLASMPGVWHWLGERRRGALGIGLCVLGGGLLLIDAGVLQRGTAADSLLANVFTWVWLLVFLGYGYRHLSFSSGLLRWARDASYPVYILHQTVIIAIGYSVIQQPWHAWTKYLVVLLATMGVCAVLYETCVRRTRPTRALFGMKTASPAPADVCAEKLRCAP
jgi:peptidoglycan/LPS O-acetylase OafA/YrhL